ncbi:hypothetical protein JCM6882_003215 [Rhodosporidiobolus microsporus]
MDSHSAPPYPPLVLTLAFPSLAHFLSPSSLSSPSLLAALSSAAARSDNLTVLVRTPTPTPWGAPPAASGSSSSSSSAPHPPHTTPLSLFLPLERALAALYSPCTAAFLKRGNVLASVDVVVEAVREVPFCVPAGVGSERWEYAADGGEAVSLSAAEEGGGEEERPEGQGARAEGDGGIYDVVALGGTFDHLHAGHKILLSMACSIAARKVIVGVSDDTLLKNKKLPHLLEPLAARMRNVERFMDLVRPGVEKEVVPLTDVYGPTAHDPTIRALVVSDETRSGGDAINELRKKKGLNELDVHVINLVADSPSPSSSFSSQPSSPLAPPSSTSSAPAPSPAPAIKVEPAAKMGSTGIREWIDRQQRLGTGAVVGGAGGGVDKAGGTI